jgi:hypothetical protein
MSLNWNIGAVNDHQITCYDRKWVENEKVKEYLNAGGFMGPYWHAPDTDPWMEQDYDKSKYTLLKRMNVTTHTLILAMMSIDIGTITEKNADEVFRRLSVVEQEGAFRNSQYGPVPFTLEEVKAHIGLTTNVATLTKAKWAAKQKRIAAQRERDRAWVAAQAARSANV